MTLAGGAFKQTWSPQANKLFTQKKPESVFADMLNHYLFGFALFAVLIITATPMIVHILAPVEFYSAIKYVGFIVVAVMWNDVTNIVGSGNAWERKTYYNTYGSFAAACISIILLYLFIEQGGVLTATLTLIVASVIKSIINLITSQNNHPIPYSYSILIVMLLFSISFALISYLLYSSPIYFTEWQASGTLLLVGIVSLFYMNKLLLKNKMITAAMLYMEEIKRGLH